MPADISSLDLRIGRVGFVQPHPLEPDSIYGPIVNIAEENPKMILTAVAQWYTVEQMENRLVVVVINGPSKRAYNIRSEALLLCAQSKDRVEPLSPPLNALPGDRVTVFGRSPPSERLPTLTKPEMGAILAEFWVDGEKRVIFKDRPLMIIDKGFITSDTLTDCFVNCPVQIYN